MPGKGLNTFPALFIVKVTVTCPWLVRPQVIDPRASFDTADPSLLPGTAHLARSSHSSPGAVTVGDAADPEVNEGEAPGPHVRRLQRAGKRGPPGPPRGVDAASDVQPPSALSSSALSLRRLVSTWQLGGGAVFFTRGL